MTQTTAGILADLNTRGLTMPARQPRPALTSRHLDKRGMRGFLAHLDAHLPTHLVHASLTVLAVWAMLPL